MKTKRPHKRRSFVSICSGSSPAYAAVRDYGQMAMPRAMAISAVVKGRRALTIICKTFLTVLT